VGKVKEMSYFEVRQIAHGGQVLPTGGHLNLLRRFGFGVSLGGELVVFAKQKQRDKVSSRHFVRTY
jgi:hypothetical protein